MKDPQTMGCNTKMVIHDLDDERGYPKNKVAPPAPPGTWPGSSLPQSEHGSMWACLKIGNTKPLVSSKMTSNFSIFFSSPQIFYTNPIIKDMEGLHLCTLGGVGSNGKSENPQPKMLENHPT